MSRDSREYWKQFDKHAVLFILTASLIYLSEWMQADLSHYHSVRPYVGTTLANFMMVHMGNLLVGFSTGAFFVCVHVIADRKFRDRTTLFVFFGNIIYVYYAYIELSRMGTASPSCGDSLMFCEGDWGDMTCYITGIVVLVLAFLNKKIHENKGVEVS
jgi:hypothetical protein